MTKHAHAFGAPVGTNPDFGVLPCSACLLRALELLRLVVQALRLLRLHEQALRLERLTRGRWETHASEDTP